MEPSNTTLSAVATLLLNQVISKSNPPCMAIGETLSDRLFTLSNTDRQQLVTYSSRFLSVNINEHELSAVLDKIETISEKRELEDQFLYACATNSMMRDFFGMHTTEFCARRKILGLERQGQHRPQYCDEKTEAVIWIQWKKSENEKDIRKRLLIVSETACQPLNVVWSSIKRNSE